MLANNPAEMSKLRDVRKSKGVTLEGLSEATGISTSQLSRMESGTRGLSLDHAIRIAPVLGVDPSEIIEEQLTTAAQEFVRAPLAVPSSGAMPKDLPVWGSAAGSLISDGFEGFHIFSTTAVDYVRRPPALANVMDAYGIYVTGDSMFPMHPHGALRIIHPHRPPAIGDSVIVVTKHWENDPGQGYIKILKRRTAERVFLEQLNPSATIEIPTKYIVSMHKVLDLNDLFGV